MMSRKLHILAKLEGPTDAVMMKDLLRQEKIDAMLENYERG